MSFWEKFKDMISVSNVPHTLSNDIAHQERDASNFAFVDVEVGMKDNKIHDIGALRHDGATFHYSNV